MITVLPTLCPVTITLVSINSTVAMEVALAITAKVAFEPALTVHDVLLNLTEPTALSSVHAVFKVFCEPLDHVTSPTGVKLLRSFGGTVVG